MTESKKPFVRLPTDIVPVNYRVDLAPDLVKHVFTGVVDISFKVNKPTRSVKLNCIEINISKVTCGDQVGTFTFDEPNETVCLEFPSELSNDSSTIHIEYTGTLNDQMRGFYRSKYTNPNEPGVEKYAAVTQFEAADARRALPCWDEPAHKATFDVTLVVPKDKVALSNMDVKETTYVSDTTKRVVFNRSPSMSTYLLAFIVGEYDYVEGVDKNGIIVRVYTPLGKKEQGRFALEIAVKTIPFYTEYFNVPYPLPKIDLIALADFAAGAMENWGLVTYRERMLLADENSPISSRQLVALVVGHELAHQWFGNLVTMEWWTDLWLNEGFATWIEYLCVDFCCPEFDIWTQFLIQDYNRALGLDALSNSHPIQVEVGPPTEVEEIFDAISYSKGSCIIRMLHNWIGNEDFRKGMNAYLEKYKYRNAATGDLWASLAAASGKPVPKVMTTWTEQMGYPVLNVESKREGDKTVLNISQKKFCADGDISTFSSMLWQVPITIATSANREAYKFVLDGPQASITLEGVAENDWIKLNPGQIGYYRVNYSSAMLTPLLNAIGSLPPQDRLGLLGDAFALARAGIGSTTDVLRLLQSFADETNFTVWQKICGDLSTINRLVSYTDFAESFRNFARPLFTKVVNRLGWTSKENESPLDALLRSLVIGQSCYYGNVDCISEAQRRFQAHADNSSPIPSDLRGMIFSAAMRNGDKNTFQQLVKLHDSADNSDERSRIYRVIGHGKTEELKKMALEFCFSEKVRNQDAVSAISSCANGKLGRELTWSYLKENWNTVTEKFKGSFMLSFLVELSTSGFIGSDKADDIEAFFKANPVPTADRTIKQSLEAIRMNTKWLERDQEDMKKWLSKAV